MILKALLVDDDRIVLESMVALLSDYKNISVCGRALGAAEALEQIDRQQPDILFLDVHMPGMDGFELVSKLPYRIDIIFVTTSEAHAVRAFELNALDYLLKPVDPDRLKMAVDRLFSRKGADEYLESTYSGEPCQYQDYLYLPMACSQMFIRADEVHCLRSHRNNSQVVMGDGRVFEIRRSLSEWERRLGAMHFYRLNREVIIQVNKVKEVIREGGEVFCLDSKQEKYSVSRRRVSGLKKLLSGEPEL